MLSYDMEQRGSKSLYEYLYQCIRDDIVAGTIAADDHLPSKRALAEHLGVSVITVENAYAQLVAEGYAYTRPRRGFYASELPDAGARAGSAAVEVGPDRDAADRASSADSKRTASSPSMNETPADLSPAVLEASRLWQRALRSTLASEDERAVFASPPAEGTPRLRRAIAKHLRSTRGMEVDPENIVVGAGSQLLVQQLVQLVGGNTAVGVEDPGYLRLTHIYRACGCAVRHIPLDEEGPKLAELNDREVEILHLMPSHQFPTGRVTSIARRYALLAWASAAPGRYLVEDDYDCEFRLAGRPIPPLASIDAGGRVVYTNTFSKSLSSALRLAYMVLPPELMGRYRKELGFYSSTVSSIDQIVLARLLESGEYERHVMRVRKRARGVRDALREALDELALGGRISMEEADAGLHCVLSVESELSEGELARRASANGIPAVPVSDFAWCAENATAADGRRRLVVRYDDLEI